MIILNIKYLDYLMKSFEYNRFFFTVLSAI